MLKRFPPSTDLVIGDLLQVQVGGVGHLDAGVAVVGATERAPVSGVRHERVVLLPATLEGTGDFHNTSTTILPARPLFSVNGVTTPYLWKTMCFPTAPPQAPSGTMALLLSRLHFDTGMTNTSAVG